MLLDADQPAFHSVGIEVSDLVMIGILVAVGERVAQAAGAARADGVRVVGEPVQHIDAVAILLYDDAARLRHPGSPAADLLFRRGGRDGGGGGLRRRSAEVPVAHHHFDVADLARLVIVHRGEVFGAEALLESELDGLLFGGLVGGARAGASRRRHRRRRAFRNRCACPMGRRLRSARDAERRAW